MCALKKGVSQVWRSDAPQAPSIKGSAIAAPALNDGLRPPSPSTRLSLVSVFTARPQPVVCILVSFLVFEQNATRTFSAPLLYAASLALA